ncbi:hypothetical protein PIIN_02557 [Serendipita indica DSM 11827]|uniref:C2H2-type domain-containing protein n=1 Tax=Serendipita indica (strain DSM 11827) TaxID=1109443 RepID=G4TBJ6_SERID|nr:hypothetical protein PIIN_02557 [Serendipita indica DSM 11827]
MSTQNTSTVDNEERVYLHDPYATRREQPPSMMQDYTDPMLLIAIPIQNTNAVNSNEGERVYLYDPYGTRHEQLPSMMQTYADSREYSSLQPIDSFMTDQVLPNVSTGVPKSPFQVYSPTALRQYAIIPGNTRPLAPAPTIGLSYHETLHPNIQRRHSSSLHSLASATSSNANTESTLVTRFPYANMHTGVGANIHTDDTRMSKKHACTVCEAAFERRYDLKRHMETHSEQKKFICFGCQKALARNDSLQRHQIVCKARWSSEDQ